MVLEESAKIQNAVKDIANLLKKPINGKPYNTQLRINLARVFLSRICRFFRDLKHNGLAH